MNIVLMLAHSIEEYDQVKLLHSVGANVFSIGAYTNPAEPADDKRPALPEVPYFSEFAAACHEKRVEHAGKTHVGGTDVVDWAKYELSEAVLDWADVIICHHFEHTWLVPQWPRLREWLRERSDRRVIWRTVGQSVEHNELLMAPLRKDGLERVAYSPKEANIPGYSGHDALIRFYKDPKEWYGWTGDQATVINITQNLAQRDPYTNWGFWNDATRGLSAIALGPGSEEIGGAGALTYDGMRSWLRSARAYLYTGTQPASYTLGLIEAMMTGIPVISIGPSRMRIFSYGPDLFEGHEIALRATDDPVEAKIWLWGLLQEPAIYESQRTRERAIELFGMARIAWQWGQFLGIRVPEAIAA